MRGHFESSITIDRPIEAFYNLMNHPERIVGLQPLIQSVEILNQGNNEAGSQTYDFVAFEHIRILGIFPMVNRIQTEMILENPPYVLHQVGHTTGGITLHQTITLSEKDTQTSVTNAIDYEAHWLIFPYVRLELTRAHTAWLQILKERAEN